MQLQHRRSALALLAPAPPRTLAAFFWESMSPNGGGEPKGELAEAIHKDLGSYDEFKSQFKSAGGRGCPPQIAVPCCVTPGLAGR